MGGWAGGVAGAECPKLRDPRSGAPPYGDPTQGGAGGPAPPLRGGRDVPRPLPRGPPPQ